MPKVTFLITGLDYAGAEMQVKQLAIGLRRKGWTVQLISMLKPKAFVKELQENEIEVAALDMKQGFPDPRAIWKLRTLLLTFQPDLVHSHMIHANLLARITRLFAKIPVLLTTAHNTNEGGAVRMLMYRVTDPLCDLTTNVSQEAVDSYVRKKASPKSKIIAMPNGINLQRFRRNQEDYSQMRQELGLGDDFVWLAVGRFVEAKDYPTMMKAWAQALEQYGSGVLLVIGDGPNRQAVEKLVSSLRISDHVRFLGIREDIPKLMNASDGYLMSSRWEGLPMVLLEASASELPIVATDVGGNGEVVKEGVSGLLARPADPGHLAEKMLLLMSLSKQSREDMGRNARDYVRKHYEMDAVITLWESLYTAWITAHLLPDKLRGGLS